MIYDTFMIYSMALKHRRYLMHAIHTLSENIHLYINKCYKTISYINMMIIILSMVQNSCTSWYGKYFIFLKPSFIQSGSLGFLPSTVWLMNTWIFRGWKDETRTSKDWPALSSLAALSRLARRPPTSACGNPWGVFNLEGDPSPGLGVSVVRITFPPTPRIFFFARPWSEFT